MDFERRGATFSEMHAPQPTSSSRIRPTTQIALGLLLCVGLLVLYVLSPVCVPIYDADEPSFETVRSLEERAARGEPFEQKEGKWYQCKSRLARAFF